VTTTRTALPLRDRIIVGLLGFYLTVAFTLELWWLLHSSSEMVALRDTNLLARLFDVYGACDRAYFEDRTPFAFSLEAINVYFTQALNVWLIYAIVKRKPYRYGLQLAVASYLSYSVVLYFLVNHVSGYAFARYRSPYTYFLLYGVNAPWLLGHLYMVWDALRAIRQRFGGQRRSSVQRSPVGSSWADVNDARPAS
jgi:hypothetical protein